MKRGEGIVDRAAAICKEAPRAYGIKADAIGHKKWPERILNKGLRDVKDAKKT